MPMVMGEGLKPLDDQPEAERQLPIASTCASLLVDGSLAGPVVALDVDAQARRWGRLVVVLLAGLRFLSDADR
jgi:hypothetical protein